MKMRIAILLIPRLPVLLRSLLLLFLLLCLPYTTATAADLYAPVTQSGCNFAAADEGSLRSAIAGVNQAAGGVCTIQITGYTIELTQPLPPITNANLDELVIDGQAHSIWARRVGRVLDIQSVKQLTMYDLTLTGGLATDTGSGIDDWGGGLRLYCGEDRECTTTLTNVSLSSNQAVEGGGLSIYCASGSRCSTRLVDSSVTANEATVGGAITTGFDEANQAFSLDLLRTTVWFNRATTGGGIRLRGADFTAIDSTIRENRATTGGGIAMIASSYILRANMLRTSIFDNEATQQGGGFYIRSADPGDVQLTLANSTVSGNRVTDATGIGGGLAMSATYGLQVDLLNTTVANNQAATGAGLYFALEDDSFAPATLLTLANSLIADNQGGNDCATFLQQPPVKGVSLLTSRGHNLDSDGSCLPPAVRQAGDLPSANADLAPLTDNRGQTWTQALRLASDAIDAGDDAICAAAPINGVDQRGDPRPQGAHCDIGAYERPNPIGCTYPNLIASDEAALRQAIRCVNLAGPGAYTITVAADISYTQPISAMHNPVLDNVLIDGQGHTLDAQGHGSVLRLDETNLAVRDLTLRGGRLPTVNDGVTPNLGGGIYTTADWNGFATEPSCTLRLERVTITDNEAYSGGGIYYGCEQPLTIIDSTVSNNRAVIGGAFSTAGGEEFYTELFVSGSTFSNNEAQSSGGAFDMSIGDGGVRLQLVNSTVSSNRVISGAGGGIWLTQSAIDGISETALVNSTVANNQANEGSGVYNRYGSLVMTNTIIADNQGGSNCILFVSDDGNGRLVSNGNNLDSDGTCLPDGVRQPSDLPSGNANLGPLADNGGLMLTHALLTGSQAIDAGNDAVCAAAPVNGVDQRGIARPQGAHCDIGAYEVVAQTTANLLFVSARSSGTAGDLSFRDEDIVAYDFNTASWQMIFDGSDVGVTKDVDAFAFHANGLLLSFNGPTVVPGLGDVDDSDLVLFTPTQLGNDTTGSFAWYLRGADVGLTTDSEDIDLIDFSADGHLVVSTIGDFATATLSGQDEDLLELADANSGAWRLFLDGAAVGLANEDINGLWIDPANGDRYLTVKDSFAFDNMQIDSDDIFVCTPNEADGCAYRLFWDSDLHDYGAENLDAIDMGVLPSSFAAGLPADTRALTPTEIAEDNEQDDLEGDALNKNLYLPIIR